jgi:hypothetical protein
MTTTAAQRSMAVTVGMPFSVTVPFPNNTGDESSRWHGAFCYFFGIVQIPDMNQGWLFGASESVFFFQSSPVLFMISGEDQTFSFEES